MSHMSLWQEVCHVGGGGGWQDAGRGEPDGPGMGSLGKVLVLLAQFWGEYLGLPPLYPHPVATHHPASCPSYRGPLETLVSLLCQIGPVSLPDTQNFTRVGGF